MRSLSHAPVGPLNLNPSSEHFALVNFPNSEGVLLHQNQISLRPYSKSRMRLAWRVSEGEELLDADGLDDNVVQVLKTNKNI